MRILITGASGFLGLNAMLQLKGQHEISGAYHAHTVNVEGVRTFRLDLSDESAVHRAVCDVKPEVILHTAGLTNVDACEDNPGEAERLNVQVSEYVARAAQSAGVTLVHVSTDHMSDGTKALVGETALLTPLNQYARTKWLAEQAVMRVCPDALIIRTNFFGWGTPVKASFSDWILNRLRQGKGLPLFVDVYITPILVNDLVTVICQLLKRRVVGTYNVAGSERVSKYDFGIRLAKIFGYSIESLRPVSVRDMCLQARRPQDMSLSTDKVSMCLGQRMPSLDESLAHLKALGEQGWQESVWQSIDV